MRIILFTGKGGVGKTTIAAATAIHAAAQGHKTLIISTDPAHSLSDALGEQLGPEPTQIDEMLYGQELDVYYSMQKYWSNIRDLMVTVFKWQGVADVMAEEMSALPGMEEASAFLWIEKYYEEQEYDLIVIDSAPTGETLTLLTLPQVTKWWVTKALPLQKFAIKTVGRVVRGTTGIPLDKGYMELENIFEKLEKIQKIFADPEICSIRLVTNPEKMVIKEAKRAYTYLQLYGYNADAVIINRIIPKSGEQGVFAKYYASQEKYIQEITDSFSPLPILKIQHQGQEVFGLDILDQLGQDMYGERDPMDVFIQLNPISFEETDDGYMVKIRAPFIHDQEYSLKKFGDEIVIDIANRRKNVFLPRFVHFMELQDYEYDEPWISLKLVKEAE